MTNNNDIPITSKERVKNYRKRVNENNDLTDFQKRYSVQSFEEKEKLNKNKRISNLSEEQLCSKYDRNKKRYKKNKKTSTLDNSYVSSLKVFWDYKNPCEL